MIRPIDKKLYCFKGHWTDPDDDTETDIFYYVMTPRTLVAKFNSGVESISSSMTIAVAGKHNFAINDLVILDTGETLSITKITVRHEQRNMAIRDLLKPRVQDIILELE